MREVVLLGIGQHKVGRFPDETITDIGRTAILEALKDAGIEYKDIQAAYFTNRDERTPCLGQHVLGTIGLTGIPIINAENASPSASTAFVMAYDAVATGQYDAALAVGAEKTARGLRVPVVGVGVNINRMMAMAKQGFAVIPGMFALAMRRRMKDFGETVEQFAQVAVKNRKHAHLNPYAHYQDVMTIEDVLNSRLICDPVTLFQCCPTSEGAAAAILCSKDVAKRYKSDGFTIVASGVLNTPVSWSPALGITTAGLDKMAADEAYNMAGLGPKDVDIIELHDPFTASELIHYEDLSLCEVGEAGKILSEGKTEIGGEIPVNTDGGLLSRGHPIGATGLYQIVELELQLRGQAGQRQVEGAKVGLGHMEGLGPCATVIILKR